MPSINVDEQLVKHVAVLAKLNLSEDEVRSYVDYMKQILSYVETLDEVDTSKVEPLYGPVMEAEKLYSSKIDQEFVTHADVVKTFENASEILKNAPRREEGQYKIKAIIEEQ